MPSLGFLRKNVASLLDEPSESARRILHACVHSTMSFWIDYKADIHADVPHKIPRVMENLIVGTYGVGTSIAHIEADLQSERRERGKVVDHGLVNWPLLLDHVLVNCFSTDNPAQSRRFDRRNLWHWYSADGQRKERTGARACIASRCFLNSSS